jgi:HSP20 family protein
MVVSLLNQMTDENSQVTSGYRHLNNEMENILNRAFGSKVASVSVNIRETSDTFTFEVDIPGVDKKDITLGVEDGVLTVSGSRSILEGTQEEYTHIESRIGKFERAFRIPTSSVDTGNITATSENGVLTITLPKKTVPAGTIKIQ